MHIVSTPLAPATLPSLNMTLSKDTLVRLLFLLVSSMQRTDNLIKYCFLPLECSCEVEICATF